MPCGEPPSTRTEPNSVLICRFRAAASEPVVSCDELPPCCAKAELARDTVTTNIPANFESCFTFVSSLSSYLLARAWVVGTTSICRTYRFCRPLPRLPCCCRPPRIPALGWLFPSPGPRLSPSDLPDIQRKISEERTATRLPFLINFRQLGQHVASLRPDVLVFVILRQLGQHIPHTAVGGHRPEQL